MNSLYPCETLDQRPGPSEEPLVLNTGKFSPRGGGTGQSEMLSPWKSKEGGTAQALPGASSLRGFAFQGSRAAAGADPWDRMGS